MSKNQTNTTSVIHNAIMKAGAKIVHQSTVDADAQEETRVMETYATVGENMKKIIDAEVEGEKIDIQDVETKLFWEFGKFTSKDGESLESYYSRMEKNEANEIRAKRQTINVNTLALVATTQQQFIILSQNLLTTLNTHQPNHMLLSEAKEKRLLELLLYHPIQIMKNNNVENTPRTERRTGYDRQTGQYENHRAVNVAGNREIVRQPVVQQNEIQSFNCKEFGHEAGLNYVQSNKIGFKIQIRGSRIRSTLCLYAKIQEVTPAADEHTGPIFDKEPLEKVYPNDDYNVFSTKRKHPE
ncbi:hypothetical protein Tco_0652563 [Tanacetum coccineum]|uniref:Uncharacterized protein n=1 Tax=Tanacetum coccineum TaxID=301880 RepID=A0ABQ4WY11_9ASTR